MRRMRIYLLYSLALTLVASVASAGELRPLITVDDYPPEALRNNWQGSVTVDLTVSPKGQVTACRVTKSSGHQVLDDATCKIMSSRARFTPALDSAGNPIEAHYTAPPITWSVR